MAESLFRGTTICAVQRRRRMRHRRRRSGDDGRTDRHEGAPRTRCAASTTARSSSALPARVADAFALCGKALRKSWTQYSGNLPRAAVELAQDWRSDKAMRKLEAMLSVRRQATICCSSPARARSSSRTTASWPSAPAATTRWPRRARFRRTPTCPRTKSPKRR